MAHAPVCQIKRCPEKSHGRLRDKDNSYRRDLCFGHMKATVNFYNIPNQEPEVIIVEQWGEGDVEASED